MSRKQWLALLMLYILYLLFGAFIFQAFEAQNDYDEKLQEINNAKLLQRIAVETLAQTSEKIEQENILELLHTIEGIKGSLFSDGFNLTSYLEDGNNNSTGSEEEIEIHHHWDIWNTFYFAFITITTIGYGHLYPKTQWGQQFCVVYSLFGIPLNTLVFVTLSTFYKDYVLTEEDQKGGGGRSTFTIILHAVLYMLPGLIVFLVLPAVVFKYVENWTFLESYYFAFISLTTIGYGEYVAGHPDHHGGWDILYKGFIMLWTVFGLSYIIMVVGFLMNALTSKHVRKMEKKTRKRLNKVTRLLQEVAQQTKGSSSKSLENKKKKEEGGVDNQAFTISDGVTEQPNHSQFKALRRKSIVEKMLPENQRHEQRRGSLPPDGAATKKKAGTESVAAADDAPNAENVETINELIAAVEDLIENEFPEEQEEGSQDQKADNVSKTQVNSPSSTSESIDLSSTQSNSTDVTIHV